MMLPSGDIPLPEPDKKDGVQVVYGKVLTITPKLCTLDNAGLIMSATIPGSLSGLAVGKTAVVLIKGNDRLVIAWL